MSRVTILSQSAMVIVLSLGACNPSPAPRAESEPSVTASHPVATPTGTAAPSPKVAATDPQVTSKVTLAAPTGAATPLPKAAAIGTQVSSNETAVLPTKMKTPASALRKLSEKDAGGTVELDMGDQLEVVLEGNPTTGFTWELVSVDSTILKQMGKAEYRPDVVSTPLVGSGGKFTWRFQADAAGQTTLQLIYHRTFEGNVPPAKTFKVTVMVK